MKTLVVTGTDTDVGKTWVSCLILKSLRRHGHLVGAYKPVCSGAEVSESGHLTWSDIRMLADACGGVPDIDRICPQRFAAPVAPHVAAELENRSIDDILLRTGLDAWNNVVPFVVIEGAGGLLSPLSLSINIADIAAENRSGLIIVAANRLGVINHTLLTIEAVIARNLSVSAVVLNDCRPTPAASDMSAASNAMQLRRLLPNIPLLTSEFESDLLRDADSREPLCSDRMLQFFE